MNQHPLIERIINEGGPEHARITYNEFLVLCKVVTPHTCKGSMMRCCGEFRCEPCHMEHLRLTHTRADVQKWKQFHGNPVITQREERKEVQKPVKQGKEVVAKHSKTREVKVDAVASLRTLLLGVSPDEVVQAYAHLVRNMQ